MGLGTRVIYDKITRRVMLFETGDQLVMPAHWGVAQYEEGIEPVFDDVGGDIYLRSNSAVLTDFDEYE